MTEARQMLLSLIESPKFKPHYLETWDEDYVSIVARILGIEPTDYFFEEGWDELCEAWDIYKVLKFIESRYDIPLTAVFMNYDPDHLVKLEDKETQDG